MSSTRLVPLLGAVVRQQRHQRELNQRELADLAGVSQAAVARIERGDRSPSIPLLERLLAAMDVQLVVGVEPLDAHLDARIDDLAARPIAERIDELGLHRMLDRLADFPQVITGSTAALLQGAPVPVEALEIAVRWQDSKRFTRWLEAAYGQRWNARWGEFGGVWLEPEEQGEHLWTTRYGEIRATMCDELPETIEVRHGARSYRVVPLVDLELTEPRAADLLRRHRARQAASGKRRS
ncbi:XRE family transcriptional regulator [Micromonospora sp. BL4]|uniref:helix-turn-helix domain-containing protein n=1 Tax=Micromonospora sp. BL4 TaxID=2478710 RepID=UPI000EF6106C|nr:helix-turn-helix transcriptional regulator [Micromonospora sp. BL4]RLP85002.1 XRE family transcriptional regulator [Micromonospora sp. BL4]